jgi:hypothetical protein
VISLAPELPANADEPVHAPCDARIEPLHPACERDGVGRFDDEMHVIRLNGKMKNAKRITRRARDRLVHGIGERIFSKRGKLAAHSHRHVQRQARAMHRPSAMRNAARRRRAWPAGAIATATPAGPFEAQRQLLRCSAFRHLE